MNDSSSGSGQPKKKRGGARPGAGRKPVLTLRPEVGDRIVEMLRVGNFFDTAASAAGVRPTEAKDWLLWGNKPDAREPWKTFAARCNEAMAQSEAAGVALINELGEKDWRALAWMLERRHGHHWRQIVANELTGKGGGPIEMSAKTEVVRYVFELPKNPMIGEGGE